MNARLIFSFLVLTTVFSFAATSQEEAEQRLHSAIDEVLGIAVKAPDSATLLARIAPVLEKHISFSVMTRRAIGPGWRQFSEAEQTKAIALFSKLIIRTYGNKFTIGMRPEIKYNSTKSPAAGRIDVATTTVNQGSRYSVIYRLEEEENWRTTDVVIEGVSLVSNYRSQLDPVFKKGGAAAVITSLEQTLANP